MYNNESTTIAGVVGCGFPWSGWGVMPNGRESVG